MEHSRRRFLKSGAALGLGGLGLAAHLGSPRARWDRDEARLGDTVWLRVRRGEAPPGAEARVRVVVCRDEERYTALTRIIRLTEAESELSVLIEHPFPTLRDGELSYRVELALGGQSTDAAAPLRVPVRRFRFSS